jgi:hypothetical protein
MKPNYNPEGTKQCNVCKETQPLGCFSRHSKSADGYFSYCDGCKELTADQRKTIWDSQTMRDKDLAPGIQGILNTKRQRLDLKSKN